MNISTEEKSARIGRADSNTDRIDLSNELKSRPSARSVVRGVAEQQPKEERLLRIEASEFAWLDEVKRWRVYAVTSSGRMLCFAIYARHEPSLPEAQAWFDLNHGEALELGGAL